MVTFTLLSAAPDAFTNVTSPVSVMVCGPAPALAIARTAASQSATFATGYDVAPAGAVSGPTIAPTATTAAIRSNTSTRARPKRKANDFPTATPTRKINKFGAPRLLD